MSTIQVLEDYLAKQLLSPAGFAQYQSGKVSKHELAAITAAIRDISKAYVSHTVGSQLASPVRDTVAAEAYALYYSVINATKILHLLSLTSFSSHEISVLDVGCGPGTAGLALLSALPNSLHLTCVEHSHPMRVVAERLLSHYTGTGSLSHLKILPSLPRDKEKAYDLVIAANVLAELDTQEGERTIRHLAERVAPGGYLLILEPGQQLHTRRLMHLRDTVLVSDPELTPLFPCFRSDGCPMLSSSETDWCHGSIEWQQPRLNAHLDDLLSFNKHRIKYSAFVFQRGGAIRDGIRVLTPPEKTRIGIETLVCGGDTYGIVRIRKGTRSENNRALEKASVFDRLIPSQLLRGDIAEDIVITASDGV
jgi:ribosomal protein RSM22 (predicted rRNA methylase)